jgi:hypothetical protein
MILSSADNKRHHNGIINEKKVICHAKAVSMIDGIQFFIARRSIYTNTISTIEKERYVSESRF